MPITAPLVAFLDGVDTPAPINSPAYIRRENGTHNGTILE